MIPRFMLYYCNILIINYFSLDEIWVHVRSLGNWTNKLNEYFSNFDLVLNEWYQNSFSNDVKLQSIQSKRSTVRPRATRSRSTFKVTSFKDTGYINQGAKQQTVIILDLKKTVCLN